MRCWVRNSAGIVSDATPYAPLVLFGMDCTLLAFPFVEDFDVIIDGTRILVHVRHSYPVPIYEELRSHLVPHIGEGGAQLILNLEEVPPGSMRQLLVAQLDEAREQAYRDGLCLLRDGRISQEQWLATGLAR